MAPICLEVLQWSDLRRAPKQGAGQQPDVLLTLRVSKAAMRGAQYQEEIINQVRLDSVLTTLQQGGAQHDVAQALGMQSHFPTLVFKASDISAARTLRSSHVRL